VQFLPRADVSLGGHTATTDLDGRFTLRTDAPNNPLRPGAYVVIITRPMLMPGGATRPGGGMAGMGNDVPPVYQYRAWTPLNVVVEPGATELPPFDLWSGTRR
jgi:hypothetical protein